jgi:hypothetical protein
MMKKTISAIAVMSLLASSNTFAARQIKVCTSIVDPSGVASQRCEYIYDNLEYYRFTYSFNRDQYDTPYLNEMSPLDSGLLEGVSDEWIETVLMESHNKTPLTLEELNALEANLEYLVKIIDSIVKLHSLSPEVKEYLEKALSQMNGMLGYIGTVAGLSLDYLNNDLEFAGTEAALILATFAATQGFAVHLTGLGLRAAPAGVIAAVSVVVIVEIVDESIDVAQEYGPDAYEAVENLARTVVDNGFLNDLNEVLGFPSIFITPAPTPFECDFLPIYKQIILGCSVFPIVLDLDGKGVDFIEPDKSLIEMDVTQNGLPNKLAWPKPGNGVVFADWDYSSHISNSTEIDFTRFSVKKNPSDLDGLKAFDYDRNNDLNSDDKIYNILKVWDDKNMNGEFDDGEVHSFSDLSISLDLKSTKGTRSFRGNRIDDKFKFKFKKTINGKSETGNGYSVAFKYITKE